ncbi:MAG: hypothetical protein JRH20_19480 [Deltaproteobacteria bacterium]|nr:hypothetical protein [Deltaproteobacteria bacterium]
MDIVNGPLAGFSLTIPPGALSEDTTITVEVLHDQDLQAEPWTPPARTATGVEPGDGWLLDDSYRTLSEVLADWERLQLSDSLYLLEWLRKSGLGASKLTYAFEPAGLHFLQPAQLTLPYAPETEEGFELWPALRIGQWSTLEPSGRILGEAKISSAAQTITSPVEHFSSYQVKTGFAGMLQKLGGAVVNGLIEASALKLVNIIDREGPDVDFDDVDTIANDLAKQMLCAIKGEPDFSVPKDIAWNELMGQLSTMTSLFTPLEVNEGLPIPYITNGQEASLTQAIQSHPSPVSFAAEFQMSMGLNNNNVFNSLLTMHNIGQDGGIGPRLESMESIHPSITDTNGAHYHMAGLALLSMFSGSDMPSLIGGLLDEAVMSGLVKGAFEPGEMLTNLAGSKLADLLEDFDLESCKALTARLAACDSSQGLGGQPITIKSNCGRSWTRTTDADGSASLEAAPAACTSFWFEATINGTLYSSTAVTIDPEIGGNLGELTVQEIKTLVQGLVFNDDIPPAASEGATVDHLGATATVATDGTFKLPERWISCDPVVVTASLGDDSGESTPTNPVVGVTNVGIITLAPRPILAAWVDLEDRTTFLGCVLDTVCSDAVADIASYSFSNSSPYDDFCYMHSHANATINGKYLLECAGGYCTCAYGYDESYRSFVHFFSNATGPCIVNGPCDVWDTYTDFNTHPEASLNQGGGVCDVTTHITLDKFGSSLTFARRCPPGFLIQNSEFCVPGTSDIVPADYPADCLP